MLTDLRERILYRTMLPCTSPQLQAPDIYWRERRRKRMRRGEEQKMMNEKNGRMSQSISIRICVDGNAHAHVKVCLYMRIPDVTRGY
jgi:hypothetical protein